jgi:hypothetical protein
VHNYCEAFAHGISQPAMLDQTRWRFLVQSNNMMQGFQLLPNGTIVRARRPGKLSKDDLNYAETWAAFQLKPVGTAWKDPQTALPALTTGTLNVALAPTAAAASAPAASAGTPAIAAAGAAPTSSSAAASASTAGGLTTDNFIPDFEVLDASSISIKETSNELEKSMVENGFSSLAVSGSV